MMKQPSLLWIQCKNVGFWSIILVQFFDHKLFLEIVYVDSEKCKSYMDQWL